MTLKLRIIKNSNITIDTQRVIDKVIENMEGSLVLSKEDKDIVQDAVITTLWELFERKEECLKQVLEESEDPDDKDIKEWEFS